MISNPALLLALGLAANASTSPPAPPPPPPPDCSAAEHRQFDFWVGDWEVQMTTAQGQEVIAGHNTVTRDLKGCTITEHWRGSRGTDGRSLNLYDRQSKRWKQFWVDSQGGLLELGGSSPKPNEMLMQSQPLNGTVQRVHWKLLDDGRVRQHWQSSTDQGASWNTVFDGYYRKVETARTDSAEVKN